MLIFTTKVANLNARKHIQYRRKHTLYSSIGKEIRIDPEQTELYTDPDKAMQSLIENATSCGTESRRCNKQARRLEQILDRIKRRTAGYPVTRHKPNGDPNANTRFPDTIEGRRNRLEHLNRTHTTLNRNAAIKLGICAHLQNDFEYQCIHPNDGINFV